MPGLNSTACPCHLGTVKKYWWVLECLLSVRWTCRVLDVRLDLSILILDTVTLRWRSEGLEQPYALIMQWKTCHNPRSASTRSRPSSRSYHRVRRCLRTYHGSSGLWLWGCWVWLSPVVTMSRYLWWTRRCRMAIWWLIEVSIYTWFCQSFVPLIASR